MIHFLLFFLFHFYGCDCLMQQIAHSLSVHIEKNVYFNWTIFICAWINIKFHDESSWHKQTHWYSSIDESIFKFKIAFILWYNFNKKVWRVYIFLTEHSRVERETLERLQSIALIFFLCRALYFFLSQLAIILFTSFSPRGNCLKFFFFFLFFEHICFSLFFLFFSTLYSRHDEIFYDLSWPESRLQGLISHAISFVIIFLAFIRLVHTTCSTDPLLTPLKRCTFVRRVYTGRLNCNSILM